MFQSVCLTEQSGPDDKLVGALLNRFEFTQDIDFLILEFQWVYNPNVSHVDKSKTLAPGIFQLKGEISLEP